MKNYKLSTAIRKAQGPTCKNGRYFFRGRSTALGGAFKEKYGLPLPNEEGITDGLFEAWPELLLEVHPINVPNMEQKRGPTAKGPELTDRILFDVISILNDSYKWPRERIADWVEELGY
jgi:hypothetical protein